MSRPLQLGFRRGQSTDMPAVLALLQSAGLPTADLKGAQKLKVWMLEGSDSVLGVIALERFGADGLLRSLAVRSDHQKCGFGRELVARVEQDAQASGVERLVLLTETAEQFFRCLGYEVIDRSSVSDELRQSAEFRSLCPASAVCMSKAIHSRESKQGNGRGNGSGENFGLSRSQTPSGADDAS